MTTLNELPLGKQVDYPEHYAPEVLCAVPRKLGRDALGLSETLPFVGFDVWNAYELSWLNLQGKPEVAVAEIVVPCESPNLIESKSLKLYFNSFNLTRITDAEEFVRRAEADLSQCAGAPVAVRIRLAGQWQTESLQCHEGELLDQLAIEVDEGQTPDAALLRCIDTRVVEETLCSHLLRSCCPVTGQPDWASVVIHYRGQPIDRYGLLRYIIGFRQQHEFHEQCVERLFCDLLARVKPEQLTVMARYTRRGGLDINPMRSTEVCVIDNRRWFRQ
jgi:7-cyano-7-deazaguanine reductase